MQRFTAAAVTALFCLALGLAGLPGVWAQSPPAVQEEIATAGQISFDNSDSGLDATNTQDAIDELASEGVGGGVSDGDKNDITVSSSGTVWNIDSGAVGATEIAAGALTAADAAADLATQSELDAKSAASGTDNCLMRATGTSGDVECSSEVLIDDSGILDYGTTSTSGYNFDQVWAVPDLDDAAGVADGAGADANPFPGDATAQILSGVLQTPDTNMLNPISIVAAFNPVGSSGHNSNLHSWGWSLEHAYGFGQRSFRHWVEAYLQYAPATHYITFSAGGSGALDAGENVTFSNGAVCRVAQEDSDLSNGAVVRMTCVSHTPPANTNTISSGCSCTGTVSGTPVNEATGPWRPIFIELETYNNKANVKLERGNQNGTANTRVYWLSCSDGANTCWIGHGGATDTNQARISIPHHSDVSGQGLAFVTGNIAIDETLNGGTPTLIISDGTSGNGFTRWAMSPTSEQCFKVGDLDGAVDDNLIPLGWYRGVTIVALGCQDDTGAPATNGTITLETLGGTAISLASTLTCSDNNTTMAWVAADTADTDRVIASGARIRYDVGTSPTATTDDHTICVAVRTTEL